ncbi:MAG: hypothetical protein MJ223_01920 [Mycoplasmoidaceae bacterium]|nr:hypothetical protein [Mycoplasmoidaceae bacterium]
MEKSDENLTCSCIGAKTDDAHSVKETLYINTIEPCVKNLINAIEELANKK